MVEEADSLTAQKIGAKLRTELCPGRISELPPARDVLGKTPATREQAGIEGGTGLDRGQAPWVWL